MDTVAPCGIGLLLLTRTSAHWFKAEAKKLGFDQSRLTDRTTAHQCLFLTLRGPTERSERYLKPCRPPRSAAAPGPTPSTPAPLTRPHVQPSPTCSPTHP